MTAWGTLLTDSFKASENGPKGKQQTKKYLFKKIYDNLVREMRVCRIWTKTTPFQTRLPTHWGIDSTLDCCDQEHKTPSIPQVPTGGFSLQ